MKLTIEGAIPNRKTPNSYEVVVTTMQGDADSYKDVIVGPFIRNEDEAAMEEFLHTLKRMSSAFPSGMSGSDTYTNTEGFLAWFPDQSNMTEKDFKESYPGYQHSVEEFMRIQDIAEKFFKKSQQYPEWTYDPNYGNPNSYDGYKVVYYDENKVAHKVTVETD